MDIDKFYRNDNKDQQLIPIDSKFIKTNLHRSSYKKSNKRSFTSGFDGEEEGEFVEIDPSIFL
jgi:hypothetical protein